MHHQLILLAIVFLLCNHNYSYATIDDGYNIHYLSVAEVGPKSSVGSLKRITGQQIRRFRPSVLDVFKNDKGFGDGLRVVQKDRNFLMDGVGLKKSLTFVGEIFIDGLVFDPFEFQCPNNPQSI